MPDVQSVLHPAGVEAARIAREWWIFLGVCTVVWLIVAAVTLLALAKGRRAASSADSRVLGRNISVATAVTVVALIALLFEATATQGALESVRSPDPLRIQVTGNQWWWDIQYVDPVPSQRVTTANEIHIPVGRSVAIDLLATDVIHSLWIPNLQGKLDLIPGRLNQLWLRADRAGVYRGQCAEYCGLQHAKMALVVVAESPNDFERWLTANRASAPT